MKKVETLEEQVALPIKSELQGYRNITSELYQMFTQVESESAVSHNRVGCES